MQHFQQASSGNSQRPIHLQVCNHPHLSYVQPPGADSGELPRRCGKLASLDRMLVKLHATGHRVLLFSTMTRLLDLLEVCLRRCHHF